MTMTDRQKYADLILDQLAARSSALAEQWSAPQGTTTRHLIIDDLLPAALASEIYNAFPRDGSGFFNRASFREKKRTSANLSDYGAILSDITYAFQDQRVVDRIGAIIGVDTLEPDPKLYAGGLSMMFKDDFLNPHIDNSHDGERAKFRRLNLLYYVSPDWKLENGGNFELWDEDRKNPVTIVARPNRLVIMETNKTSWHSVSPVVADATRCCVSNYYFSEISPDATEYFHVTSFSGRPDELFKRGLGAVDNALRNVISKTLKLGRGKELVNRLDE
jgi:Rps23 Pro-64 3,4-dihydroxylase Tpa1-like proline 4-hydroxylase